MNHREYADISYVALKDEDLNSFLDFENNIGEKNPYLYGYGGLSSQNAEKSKLPIPLEHPFVNVVANFAIDAFNSVCNMHFKVCDKNLYDAEILECKYMNRCTSYYFLITIEAFEEGNLGVYNATVVCSRDESKITLSKFVLTNATPVGMKAMKISPSLGLRHIYKSISGLQKDIDIHLQTRRTPKPIQGKKKGKAATELISLKEHNSTVISGLLEVLNLDIHSLFPRKTNEDHWIMDAHKDYYTGLVLRKEGTPCKGYDFYNRFSEFAFSLLW